MIKKPMGLMRFLKGSTDPKARTMPGCSNYDHHRGGCVFGDACKVEQGKRCGYFERTVLPTGTGEVYQKYESHCGLTEPLVRPAIRLCACGAVLKYRQRYCADCSRRRRQIANRESQQKYRESRRMTVSS